MVVPNLFGTDQGALAGRLPSDNASIADSPMRVETGAARGLGSLPTDKDSGHYSMANVVALER